MTIRPPRPFYVLAEVTAGPDKGYRYRVGTASTIEAARELVENDKRLFAHPKTYGGLIAWGPSDQREYAIFQATYVEVE